MISGYAETAETFAAHAAMRAQAAAEPIARRLWEVETAKEQAVAQAYRLALAQIYTAISEDVNDTPA
ncbi:hypothetical protein K2Z83_26345 [Oscillochloris sp. ZM17-4]|nr:hypothetical protein [Oscillochloris sp. ZM17-4]